MKGEGRPGAARHRNTGTVSFFANLSAVAGARMLSIVSQVLVLPVIARYLTIADFGAVALAMSIIVFAQLLSDCGMGRSLVRQAEVDPEEWDSVFWLLSAVGAALFLFLFATAGLWAVIFDVPQLTGLVQALSVVPLLQSLSAVSNAALERAERFLWLGGVRAVSVVLGLVAAIALAVAGAGAWSLIVQQLVLFATIATGAVIGGGYRPQFRLAVGKLATHLRFARDTMGTSFVFMVQNQAPIILLGAATGAVQLGLFSMAQRLLRLPELGLTGPASQVVFVRMARHSSDPGRIAVLHLAALRLLALAVFPAFFCLAGAVGYLVPLVLSERWFGVAMVFALAAPGFALQAVNSTIGVVFQATGATALRLRMATERAVLQVAAVAVAVPFGINAVALALSLFAVVYAPRLWFFTARVIPCRPIEMAHAIAVPLAAGTIGWLICALVVGPSTPGPAALPLLGFAAITVATIALAALGQRAALSEAIGIFRDGPGPSEGP